MTEPLVSLIVAIHNGEQFIARCLESLTTQTYEHLEILCVVNGSTDASEQLIAQWCEKDARVKLLTTDIGDLGHASNLGVAAAQGAYIGFVDVDDWVAPTYVERLLAPLQQGHRLSKCNVFFVHEDGQRPFYRPQPSRAVNVMEANFLLVSRHSALYDRTLFAGLKYLEHYVYEDLSLWPILVAKAGGAYYVNEPLYYYERRNEGSIMSVRDERHLALDKVMDHCLSLVTPELGKEVNLLITSCFINAFWTSNLKYVDTASPAGQAYLRRLQQTVAGRLPGYFYIVEQLAIPAEMKQRMRDFYRGVR